ncbi:MAG: C25 family cysteine peptidase, partial [Chitinophagales bacterium]|nr:C25 family cysteine peptidase [Chitinophagales bacterium]
MKNLNRIFCYIAIALAIICCRVAAQNYGNEWIDYNRTHFKIKVWQDGIYRIPYSTLAAAIPNISMINPANIVMYHNGQQVPIYISNNTALGQGDFIEFFGVRNRGEIDSLLYVPRGAQPHPYYSLFTDTSVYFLTTSSSTNNRRLININNDLTNLPPKENFFMHPSLTVFLNSFFEGKVYYAGKDELSKSLYEEGEGWSGGWINSSPTETVTNIPTPFVYTGPGSPGTARFRFYHLSRSNSPHILTVKVNGQVVFNTSYAGWRQSKFEQQIPLGLIANGTTPVSYRFSDNSPGTQQNRIQLIEITYPRLFDFGGANFFRFQINAGPGRKYLDISNFNDNNSTLILYDITNGLRITSPAGSSKFALPPSSVNRDLILGSESIITNITAITPIEFKNYTALANQGNFVIISHPSLGVNDPKSQVEQYRLYRDVNGGFGGKFIAVTVDVEQLYDQFAYGISKHPLAIVNFIQYAVNNWSQNRKPRYVLLLGKAREYPDMRVSAAARNQCLVPTFGYPGSDILLACPIGSNIPSVAIGRLAAQTQDDIKVYLDKLKTYESLQAQYAPNQSIPEKEWMKQVLHFSGGTSATEQVILASYVNNWKRIIEDTSYGAKVTTFSKNSPAPIDQSQQQVVKSIINRGISLLTFFGHSSSNLGFDVSIDEPNNYTNYNRYPIIISNGCLVGFIHSASRNYSERFVIPRANENYQGLNTGAIAFLATTGLSLSASLNIYTTRIYENLARSFYTRSLGDIISKTMSDLNSCCSGDHFTMMVGYEFTLHGDPALTINQYPKPDYAIDNSSLYFNPSNITAASDTFEAKLIVTNLGKALPNTIRATLYRRVRDPQNPSNFLDLTYHVPLSRNYYKDTVTFRIPTLVPYGNSYIGYGANEFGAFIESEEKVDEMAEFNNRIPLGAIVTNIQSDDIIPIYPYEFAIVPKQGVTLKASTVNPFAPYRAYRFEIDTTELFNSPLRVSGVVAQKGGVVKFTPNIIMQDSTVYYWRVGIDSGGTGKNW